MFHEFTKLLLDFSGLHDLLGVVIVLKAHCLVSDEEVPQQQRLLDLICVDADCFQEGQSGQHTTKGSMYQKVYTFAKSTCKLVCIQTLSGFHCILSQPGRTHCPPEMPKIR